MTEPSNLRDAAEVWDGALSAYWISDNSVTDAPGYAAAAAIIEADRAATRADERAKVVGEIVAWLRRAGEYGSERAYAWGDTFADQIEAGEWDKTGVQP